MCGRHVCLLTLVLVLAGAVVAQEWDFEIPSTTRPPDIDGYLDAVWSMASVQYPTVPINGNPNSPENCSGSWRVLWDAEYLYVIADINDNTLVNDSGSSWQDDSVEVYFDGGNSKGPGAPLSDDDRQYTFGWTTTEVQGTNIDTTGVEHAQVNTETGYRIEIKLPWSSLQAAAPQLGDLIGIDCFINDDDDGGDSREYQLATFADDTGDWEHPSDWGTAVLVRGSREKASGPQPADRATDVPREVALEWTAGELAATHDVYLGTTLADVTNANRADPLGVLASQNQAATSFDPPGRLEFGQTYYWRIDEVNAPPDGTIYEGIVWSFTVEPRYYPIENIVASASIPTAAASGGPQATVDGSGLTNGQHSLQDAAMWLGDNPAGDPVWIQYDFDNVYKVYQLHLWNYNGLYEGLLGFGCKDVTIEYAAEPNAWTVLGDFTLDRATSKATYAGQVIDLAGVAARSIRINVHSNFSGRTSHGLAEVQFLHKPVAAREPQPFDGATGVDRATTLAWRPGREAASHQVQFDTDEAAVAGGTALVGTVASSPYSPGGLNLGTQYYWRIDEVNDAENPTVWPSPVWSFITQDLVAIEDFESYSDDEGNRIYETWTDGYGVPTNGSQVGHENAPYAEKAIVHGGRQAMPFYYDNTNGVANSQVELAFTPVQDWTVSGANTLSLHYRGQPTGFFEMPSGTILMNGIGADIYNATDQFRFAYKQLTGDGSITVRVDRIDETNEWAKAGVMIRSALGTLPLQAHMIAAPSNRVEWQYRPMVSGNTTQADTGADSTPLPYWVRLTRQGNTFTGQRSADGQTWLPLTAGDPASSQTDIAMTDPVYIGLVVTSHTAGTICGAEFSNIAVTGNVSAGWQLADVGVAQSAGNGIDRFYLTVEDSAGRKATFTNPSATAVSAGSWQQWKIPLSDITAAGANPAQIAALRLGVGDSTQPSKNVSGLLYIDDVAFGHPMVAP